MVKHHVKNNKQFQKTDIVQCTIKCPCADRVESGSNVAVHKTSISEKRSPVSYSCIPFNDHGNGPTATITVTVHLLVNHDVHKFMPKTSFN